MLKFIFFEVWIRENFQVLLALYVKNSAIKIEFAFTRDCLQKLFNLDPVSVKYELAKERNFLGVAEQI